MHQVRYFLAVADELNFTRAAERCNVAQPSLTRAIRQLEAERQRLAERERFLAARETALASLEQELQAGGPSQPYEERERELLLREARLDADHDIREEKLEKREAECAAREEKLGRREGDLGQYVAQVQDEWWAKQLGSKPLQAAS